MLFNWEVPLLEIYSDRHIVTERFMYKNIHSDNNQEKKETNQMSSNSNYKVWHNSSCSYRIKYWAPITNHEVEEYLSHKTFSEKSWL